MSSMPYSPVQNHYPPDPCEVIVGVDTHQDCHVAAAISGLGVLLGHQTFPATAVGYRELLTWARSFGDVRRTGVECTGSYGMALTRYLLSAGMEVIEVNQTDKGARRKRGKTDMIDAELAARAVLSGRATAIAKTNDGPADVLRIYKNARSSAVKARTGAIHQLNAIVVRAEPELREQLAGMGEAELIRTCAALTTSSGYGPSIAAIHALRVLAQRILYLNVEINDLLSRIKAVVTDCRPEMLERTGVGPDSAATLLVTAGDNPDRLRSEASFAALCGASPVEASSGRNQRHRLNRGGDRQANRALHVIVMTRIRCDERTRSYLDKRISEGKTKKEAYRCLKRYVAREIYALVSDVKVHA